MMKRLSNIKMLAVAGLMAATVAAPFALAQTGSENQSENRQERRAGRRGPGFGRGGHFPGRHFSGRMMQQLNLSDAQKEQMKQIRQSHSERTKALRAELRAKRVELRKANQGDTFNEALARQQLTEIAGIEAQLMGEQFKLRQEMGAVLTPEQKTQLDQMREQFKSKRGKGRGEGRGRRGEQQRQS